MKPVTIVLTLAIGLTACQNDHFSNQQTTNEHQHWSYQGNESPEHWAELSPAFIKCAEGHFQSPIDIHTYETASISAHRLQFNYHPSKVEEVNNGHTIEALLKEDNTLQVDDHTYELKQFHFHEPSEHHLDGMIFPMEMHLVHADTTGKLAVVGIFIKEGPENQDLQALWSAMPTHAQEHSDIEQPCDISHLLPDHEVVYHYNGSLTTPPCTEGVDWFVLQQPLQLSIAQIERFRALYHGNNRPVQEIEEREVEAFVGGQ